MLKEITKFINERKNGIFLLNSPTGFGKTTAVIDYIVDALSKNDKLNNKIFFITNLKVNLPWKDLKKRIGDDMFKKRCLNLESIIDPVIRNFKESIIKNKEITESKEYNDLKSDIENYNLIVGNDEISEEENEDDEFAENKVNELNKNQKIIKILKQKILNETEPAFRKMIKQNYFFEKSQEQKNSFLKENSWLKLFYPAIDLEKKDVVFLTTKKFTLPIDTFTRVPYYLCQDNISNESIFFIDEFDATKKIFLSTIIDNEIDVKVDSLKLFLEIYGSLKNIKLPKILNNLSNYAIKKKEENNEWLYPEAIIQNIQKKYEEFFNENGIEFLFKSKENDKAKAFLFYDGKNLTISDDKAKTYFSYEKDTDIFYNSIKKEYLKNFGHQKNLNFFINNLELIINYFINGILMIAINYMHYKIENSEKNDIRYSLQDSKYTVLNAFNISSEFEDVIFQKAIDSNFYNFGKVKLIDDSTKLESSEIKEEKIANDFYYKGFYFTEIKDDTKHDLQSKFHTYTFSITPESIILGLCKKSKVIGISATAKIDTVIGNYDINFFKKEKELYYDISDEGNKRIRDSFKEYQDIYDKEQININLNIIDDFQEISDLKNTKILLSEIYDVNHLRDKYNDLIEKSSSNYYNNVMFKLVKVYKEFIMNSNINSFISFINFNMHKKSKIPSDSFFNILKELCQSLNVDYVEPTIINSDNYSYKFKDILKKLNYGGRVFIITTYQTIGSGKNIQYEIPNIETIKNAMLIKPENRNEKDFDGIYISTPTNLIQNISFKSENKYKSLAKYLYDQKYLNSSGKLNRNIMISNISNAFKIIFYNGLSHLQNYTEDVNYYTAQIAIQAIGRICRCKNKNKNIYIYSDSEIVKRISSISDDLAKNLLNKEFEKLLNYKNNQDKFNEKLKSFSSQNANSFSKILKQSNVVRSSLQNIEDWKAMRDYALINPTTNNPADKYKEHYFSFGEKCSSYSYNKGNRDFSNIKINSNLNKFLVSDAESGLNIIMKLDFLKNLFEEKTYAIKFTKNDFIMNESFYKQVYKAALGEFAGKAILDEYMLYRIKELDIQKYFEYFDYGYENIYFDFKNWVYYEKNRDAELEKIKRKLNRLNGKACFIINLFKRENSSPIEDVEGKVFEIPYLIDPETNTISLDNIDYISNKMLNLLNSKK